MAALLPGRIIAAETSSIGSNLPAESDRRLWELVKTGASDPGAAATLQRLKMLLRIDALRGLPAAAQLDLARHLWLHRAAPGTIIARQGDVNDDVFFLLSGRVEAVAEIDGSEKITASVVPGRMFGDETFFTRRPRQASMRASEPAECLAIKGSDLRLLGFDHPALLMAMAGAIGGRALRPYTH
jgi:CRP-like cAMP-binding protein